MKTRTVVKWLHWLSFALIMYFFIDEPDIGGPGLGDARGPALDLHAGFGLILGILTTFWFFLYFGNGPLGRPGPKLPAWGIKAHYWLNSGLYWAVPAMVATGALAGLAAAFPIWAFGLIPLNFGGAGTEQLHDFVESIHEIAFDMLTVLIIAHGAFHIWRHVRLRDNALRIMTPKALHKYL